MLKPVKWSKDAEIDFTDILTYLKNNWSTKVVTHFIDVTESIIEAISLNPNQFQMVYKSKTIRKCVITKQNTLYFKDSKNEIMILRIFDTRQNPKKLKLK